MPEFALINYTDALYPVITKYPYPKPGQTNSAVRVGVVSASGGPTRWVKAPGDPAQHLHPPHGLGRRQRSHPRHLNRLQNTNTVFLANADTGETRTMFHDQDDAWVEVNDSITSGGSSIGKRLPLSPASATAGVTLYAVSETGDARLITNGPFDLVSLLTVDEPGGWLYYIASPDNATQRYLYRSRLDGTKTERVTPANQPGTHTYNVSPDGHWAFHTVSTFDSPGLSDLIRLPDHKVVRVTNDNAGAESQRSRHPSRTHRDSCTPRRPTASRSMAG